MNLNNCKTEKELSEFNEDKNSYIFDKSFKSEKSEYSEKKSNNSGINEKNKKDIKRGKKKLKSLFFRKNEVKTQNNDVKTCQNSNKNLNDNNHNYEIMINDELLIMDYEKAIKKNKRTWIKMYFHYLLEKNFIINTFSSESFINLRSIKINYLCFRLEIIFALNALFYSDNYISKAYHNNGQLYFFTSLPKALYSFLFSILIAILLKWLTNNKKGIYNIIRNKDNKLLYNDLIHKLLFKIKIKLLIISIKLL